MSTYHIKVLVGQPECSYPGEFAPRVIAAFDEYTLGEVPEALEDETEKAEKSGLYTDVKCVEITVDENSIFNLFKTPQVQGTVTPIQHEE